MPDPVQVRPNLDLPAPNNHGQVPSNDGTQVGADRVAGPPDDDQSAGFGAAIGDDDSDYDSDPLFGNTFASHLRCCGRYHVFCT